VRPAVVAGHLGSQLSQNEDFTLMNETQEEATTRQKARERDYLIVDNSISGWTALRYLKEWADIAEAFDIATGHFDIGALLALREKWHLSRRSGS
jgi:hypothetical protein